MAITKFHVWNYDLDRKKLSRRGINKNYIERETHIEIKVSMKATYEE